MRRLLIISFLFGIFTASLHAQDGVINIQIDPEIESLINKHKRVNEQASREIFGFRIQIIQSTSRNPVFQKKAQFTRSYGYRTYTMYNAPYFKLRVGDFETRLQAFRALQSIKRSFSEAFIVRQKIKTGGI